VSAAQLYSTNFDRRTSSNGDEFRITQIVQNNAERNRALTTAKKPGNANNDIKPMFGGLLEKVYENDDESRQSESTQGNV